MEKIIIVSATACVLIFGVIGIIDGFYYHLWKFKLHKHPETRFEHWTHTIRAALFLVLLIMLFLYDFGGYYLLLAVAFVILDVVVLLVDLISEKDSRRLLGGLPHTEYIIHVIANTFHYIALALILVAKPLSAWEAVSPLLLDRSFPRIAQLVAINLLPGVGLMVVLHLLLMSRKASQLFDDLQQKLLRISWL